MFGGNLSYFTLYLTDNLTDWKIWKLLLLPSTFKWAKLLISNLFSEAPPCQMKEVIFYRLFASFVIKKVMSLALWFDMHWLIWLSFILTCCLMNLGVLIQSHISCRHQNIEVSDQNIVALIPLTFSFKCYIFFLAN